MFCTLNAGDIAKILEEHPDAEIVINFGYEYVCEGGGFLHSLTWDPKHNRFIFYTEDDYGDAL